VQRKGVRVENGRRNVEEGVRTEKECRGRAEEGGLYCPPLIPGEFREFREFRGMKFGWGTCKIQQSIPPEFGWELIPPK
jgi:hypothetical protein